jgi:hypothetical protein
MNRADLSFINLLLPLHNRRKSKTPRYHQSPLQSGNESLFLTIAALYRRPRGAVNEYRIDSHKMLPKSHKGWGDMQRIDMRSREQYLKALLGRAISRYPHMGKRVKPCYPTGILRIRGIRLLLNRSTKGGRVGLGRASSVAGANSSPCHNCVTNLMNLA